MHVLVELPLGKDGEEITIQVIYESIKVWDEHSKKGQEIHMLEVLQYNNQQTIEWSKIAEKDQEYITRMCEENYMEDHLT